MHRKKRGRRKGATNIEVLISAAILLTVIGTLSSFAPRLGRLWKNTRNHQLATQELVNQLEYLTALPESQLDKSLSELRISSDLESSLPNAKLSYQLRNDEYGRRIILSIDWDRGADAVPLSMVAWLASDSSSQPSIQGSNRDGEGP